MRCYLDPSHAETTSIPYVHKDIPTLRPPHLRAFGYHPPLSQLEAGDLLLFAPKNPSAPSQLIIDDQAKYFDEAHARSTHCAVYIRDGKIVERTPRSGTAQAYLHSYIPTHDILVRRNTSLTPGRQAHIAIIALAGKNSWYPFFELGTAIWRQWIYSVPPPDHRNYEVCTGLFYRAFLEATGMVLEGCPADGVIKPAHFSMTETLSDVDIPWMKLAHDRRA